MGVHLEMDSSAVTQAINLQMIPLGTSDLPPMDPGMTNVTGGQYRGYRLLPHGTHFSDKIKLRFAYDPNLLPAGLTAKDVRTYYFDTIRKHWMPLEVSACDETGLTLASLTNHFTDFVNATITVPDHPDDVSFNPNQIKDIKAADPGSMMNLIEPPQANNQGTANLSYPIEVPPGRKGLEPQLAVQYNSGGGDSWMGMGWDLTCPQITVETRWGSPRYDTGLETETYLLNGEMLVEENPPGAAGVTTYMAHRPPSTGFVPRSTTSAPVTFHTRVEGKFQRVLRYGTEPNNYWWEVDEKDGMRSFYGAKLETKTPAKGNGDAAVLTDDVQNNQGNIFVWALREMEDLHGNTMLYHYSVQPQTVPSSGLPGHEIYPDHITYTGTGGSDGSYEVDFIHASGRPDVMASAKGRFPRLVTDTLNEIDVKLDSANGGLPTGLIRSWKFVYQTGAFDKTLLASVQQFGPNNTPFPGNTHTFDYFNEIQPDPVGNVNQYNGFSQTSWNSPANGINDGVNIPGVLDGNANSLGGQQSTGTGFHLFVGYSPPGGIGKQTSLGGKIGFNNSSSEGRLQLIDINGDGLPDLVYRDSNNNIWCRLNQSGPNGTFSFGAPKRVNGISEISHDNSSMFGGGFEIYLGGVNGVFNSSNSSDTQSVYLSDGNGDGIPDLVNNGTVYFGQVDASGNISFASDSGGTPNPLGAGAAVQSTGLIPNAGSLFQTQADSDPVVDVLKQWNAPVPGIVSVQATVTLEPPPASEAATYTGNPGWGSDHG